MRALCSAHLVNPFVRAILARDADRDQLPKDLRDARPDERVPLQALHTLVEDSVERFRDEEFGLKVGAQLCLGEAGPLDYFVKTAATLREAVEAAGRYSKLHADSYRVLFEVWRGHGLIRVTDEHSWPRAVADFAMSATYKLHVREQVPVGAPLECWFPYAEPRDLSVYTQTFEHARLRFNAPFHAFAFSSLYELAPQPGANPMLHTLLRDQLDALIRDVAASSTLRPRATRVIEHQLREHRHARVTDVARALRMSRRTLTRQLEAEGTSFPEAVDSVRRKLAFRYLRDPQRPLAEIAFVLGFQHVESFHRAFKRWTGTTPRAFRASLSAATDDRT